MQLTILENVMLIMQKKKKGQGNVVMIVRKYTSKDNKNTLIIHAILGVSKGVQLQ